MSFSNEKPSKRFRMESALTVLFTSGFLSCSRDGESLFARELSDQAKELAESAMKELQQAVLLDAATADGGHFFGKIKNAVNECCDL